MQRHLAPKVAALALLAPKVAALALLAPKVQIQAVLWLLGCFGALGTSVLAAGCLGAPVLGDSGACSRCSGADADSDSGLRRYGVSSVLSV
jgi:hypothetical protein